MSRLWEQLVEKMSKNVHEVWVAGMKQTTLLIFLTGCLLTAATASSINATDRSINATVEKHYATVERQHATAESRKRTVWGLDTTAGRPADDEMRALSEWRAGAAVSVETVKRFGMERCFMSEEIPDGVWARMQGKTYTPNAHISRGDLRHVRVLHWDGEGKVRIGEMVCNQKIASDLVEIFKELYNAKYPIERMVLPDVYDADDERQMRANNTSCFCYRNVANSKTLSKHAMGLAVDLNTLYNPYVRHYKDGRVVIQPTTAAKYCNRAATFPYKIDHNDLAYKLFKQHGFKWGGDWKQTKDYQHFER